MKSENTTHCTQTGVSPAPISLNVCNSILDAVQVASPLDLCVQLLLPSVGTEPRNGSIRRFPPLCY